MGDCTQKNTPYWWLQENHRHNRPTILVLSKEVFFVVLTRTEATGNDRKCERRPAYLPLFITSLVGVCICGICVCTWSIFGVFANRQNTMCERHKRPPNPPSVVPIATGVELGVGLSTALIPLVFFLHSKATCSLHSLWQFIPQSETTHKECTNV